MKNMRKFIILLFVLFSFTHVKATHIMGGEITWECISDPLSPDYGKYIFTMKLYRDCDGTTLSTFAQTIFVHNHPSINTISVDWVSSTDISPDCDVTNSGNAALDCVSNPVGAVEEYIYQSQPISLPGSPPIGATPTTNGWHFTWDSCCRNGAISNLTLSSTTNPSEGFTLRASMYAYLDAMGLPTPAEPCFDNSPLFNESPKTIICTGYPFSYTHNASDLEMDSLRYNWDEPLDDLIGAYNPPLNPVSIPWLPPYSANSPLPGNPTLNQVTGEISYFSANTAGNFVTVVRVDAYKCGQLVAQIYREIQAVLIACPPMGGGVSNNPPSVTQPFGPPTPYYTSVPAGSFISFNVSATDGDIYSNGSLQDVTLEITGGQLASDYITTTACANPPCATFTNGAGLTPPFSGPGIVNGVFEWQTACSHVATAAGCGATSNTYTFAIKAYDDYCPANAITIATVTVEVTTAASLPPPDLQCVFLDGNGNVTLDWNHNSTATNSTVYHIYASDNVGGPYNLIADVNYPLDDYVIPASSVPSGANYYYLTNESTCADESFPSDTITPIEFQITNTNVSCWDDSDGYISIEVLSNMLSPFSYYIDGVLNPNPAPYDTVFAGLNPGTYNITVSDNGSCEITQPIIITAPGFPLQVLVSDTMNTCFGQNLGVATATGAGGTPPYSYEWFDQSFVSFSTNDSVSSLSSGSYYIEIEDANGCDTFTTVQVISPQAPLTGSPQLFGVACRGDSTGYIVGDAGGSYAPYKYFWLDNTGDTIRSTGYITSRDTLSGLSVGSYDLHVYDAQDCFISYSLSIGEPATHLSIDSLVTVQDIACYGDSIGKARMFVSGGMPNYTYLWDNGETTLIASQLTSGYHNVSVTDAWGCMREDSIYINENAEIQSDITVVQTVSCYGGNDGIASISSTGGIPAYTYFWSNGHTGFNMPDTAYNLYHGSYYVTTRDVLGCEVIDSVDISQPEPLTMEASQLAWISCYGANDGLAYAYAQGGTAPYTFTWMPNGQQGDTINTLTPGVHTVTVIDARGCVATDTVTINEPPQLFVNIDDNQTILAYCIGVNTASLTAIASGGTPGYSYLWDDNLVAPQTTLTASNLLAGVYTITVTDSRGCVATDTRDIDTLTNTMAASANSLVQYNGGYYVSCFGANDGQAIVNAWGAHAPYSYQWYGPNGFNSQNDTIINLYEGTYSVTVMDTNNCVVNASILITEPNELQYTTLSSESESCLGACNGLIHVSLNGGTSPYIGIATNNNTGHIINSTMSNDSIITGICSGDYTISLSDANGCASTLINGGNAQQNVGANNTTVATIDVNSINHVLCAGLATGSMNALNPITNNPNYSYSWQNVNNPGVTISNGVQAGSLTAGSYVLLAHYADSANLGIPYPGCTSTDTATITELPQIEINPNGITHVDCYGANTGSISTIVNGGTPPYVLQWNPSINPSTPNVGNLNAGTYTLSVTDANLCQQVDTFEIMEPSALNVSITENNFTLTVQTVNGGTPPYTYSWREQSSPNTSIATGTSYVVSSYGTYYVRVKDANDCVELSNNFTYNPTGIEESSNTITIYPNPFRDEATLDFGEKVSKASVVVTDMYGKQITEYEIINQQSIVIDGKNMAKGLYFVNVEVNNKQFMVKLIVE